MKQYCLVLLLMFLGISSSYAQVFSSQSLFAGVGYGGAFASRKYSYPSDSTGTRDVNGPAYVVGYQMGLSQRLRGVYDLSIGVYRNNELSEEIFLLSNNLNGMLNYDVVKMGSFSLFVGVGLRGNLSYGHIVTYVAPGGNGNDSFLQKNSTYSPKEWKWGWEGSLLLGCRWHSRARRMAYELRFLEVNLNPRPSTDRRANELIILRLQLLFNLK